MKKQEKIQHWSWGHMLRKKEYSLENLFLDG